MFFTIITGVYGVIKEVITTIFADSLIKNLKKILRSEDSNFKHQLKKYALEVKKQIISKDALFWSYFSLDKNFDFDNNYILHTGTKSVVSYENIASAVPFTTKLEDSITTDLTNDLPVFNYIIGEFGTGKSSLIVYLYYEYLKKHYKKSQRIPIIIPMKFLKSETNKLVDIIEQIRLFLEVKYDMKNLSYTNFVKALQDGEIILFLDGLDEFIQGGNRQPQELTQLIKIMGPKTKMLITSRPSTFTSTDDFRIFFEALSQNAMNVPLINIIKIDMLKDEQIHQVLKLNGINEKTEEYIFRNKRILELCRQHIILKMVIETLPMLKNETNSADIYKSYIEKCAIRETNIIPLEIIKNCEKLALLMYQNGSDTIHSADENSWLSQLQINELLFLIRTKEDSYRFIHRSFMEYFVARGLVRAIREDNLKNIKDIEKVIYHEEICHFVREMLTSSDVIKLKKLLDSDEPWIRFMGAHFLSRLNVPNIKEILLKLLEKENDFSVKRELFISIAFLGEIEKFHEYIVFIENNKAEHEENDNMIIDYFSSKVKAIDGCIKRLVENPYYPTREMIIEFIGRYGNREHISVIRKFIDDSYESIRNCSIKSIKLLKEKSYIPENIRLIILDLDGVIINSINYHINAWASAAQNLGFSFDKADEDIIRLLEGKKSIEIAQDILERKGIKNIEPLNFVEHKNQCLAKKFVIEPMQGITSLIHNAYNLGIKIAIVTGSSRQWVDIVLNNISLISEISIIISEEDVNQGKPSPESYKLALIKSKCESSEAIVIENAPLGIDSAQGAHIYCYGLTSTLSNQHIFFADEVIDNLDRVNLLFDRNFV